MLSISIVNKTCPVACCQVAAFSSEPFLDGPQLDSLLLVFPSLLTLSRAEMYFGMITSVLRRSYAVFLKKQQISAIQRTELGSLVPSYRVFD